MFEEFRDMFAINHYELPSVLHLMFILISLTVLGFIVSLTYRFSAKNRTLSQGYALTLIIIPPIVATVVLMVGTNLTSALSLGGALALIRFRSVRSDPADIAYVLFCTAIGITGSRGLMLYALCITLLLCAVMLFLHHFRYAAQSRTVKTLRITIPENFNHQNAFDAVFAKYSAQAEIRSIRTTDLGSLFEITYNITMPNEIPEKAFLDDIRALNGNLPVLLVLACNPNNTDTQQP